MGPYLHIDQNLHLLKQQISLRKLLEIQVFKKRKHKNKSNKLIKFLKAQILKKRNA